MGDFCVDLKTQLDKFYSFLCVDPSSDLINEARRNGIDSIIADALEFSLLDNKYDIIILKEMIHHISIDSLTKLFQNISKQLNDNGLVLIVTRPVHTDFPFFKKVKKIWSTTQPELSVFTSSLLEANYNIEVIEWDYFVTMKKDNWYKFIKNRSFSEFSLCTDNELEEGIQELEVKYKDTDTLKFNDKLLLIIARKK
jgi:cyclopropane fatty-acyl-phospholipid synthase-like methyltransferase